MNDIDALLKQYEQPAKSNTKENVNTQQQQKSTKQSGGFLFDDFPQQKPQQPKFPLPKYDSDNRKGNMPLFSHNEQRRTTNIKQSTNSSVDQSLDIDAILQGRSIQPQQPPKHFHSMGPAKNSASSSSRKDSELSDWLNDDHLTSKTHTQKVTTNVMSKPAINLNPDDFFSSQDQNENKPPVSTTKASAKQYYMGNSRYKPGKNFFCFIIIIGNSIEIICQVLIHDKQYVVIVLIGF